ncbi:MULTISPECIES: nucleoside hydrolase [Rhizobium]|uniref:Inosine-uridine preferring nucleoside hydrolase n=1 Tax=Rhizobium favelukesii TaxID=348824 RepID=W6RU00_9HYPH|nr:MULTISPECIES: nucleoside hydrolase [Rhizobium]MCS0458842.1 nucleoside hydrolase [Rhizobium favelukesii]UFS80764.1 nucleoside hydrolase [Rhizobium sp. T136]CDM57781.1 inosine-uridine preferring nucleoside hydrolase [Rhizobium favelukesii]
MHKVIYDTDPGVDDAMALLFLHRHPEIDLIGITTVFGNASVETTTRNALFLKREWNIPAPVAKGASVTIDPERREGGWPTFVHGENGLGNIKVPETIDLPLDPRSAHRFIIDTVRANPGEVRLVAVGRMTNLAMALKEDPEIAGLVKDVVIMGGNFYVPGNVSPVAEANIHGDPEAADIVLTAPWRVAVIGLDVTAITTMSRSYLADVAAKGDSAAKLLNDLSQDYIDFYKHAVEDGMMVHDSCACVYVVAPELFSTIHGPVRVVCGGIADGQTIVKPDGRHFPPGNWDGLPSQVVCTGIDSERVINLIRDAVLRA